MHNGPTVRELPRDKASAAAAMPYGAWTVCTLITHGSGALPGFTSSTFVAAALDQVGGKKEVKKKRMQFKWTVAVARGAKWTTNYDEVATKIMQPTRGSIEATTPVST